MSVFEYSFKHVFVRTINITIFRVKENKNWLKVVKLNKIRFISLCVSKFMVDNMIKFFVIAVEVEDLDSFDEKILG